MKDLILCYARSDEALAQFLTRYLEGNLSISVSSAGTVVGPEVDLIEAAERALSAEAVVVILSAHSVPKTWDRKVWEPVFIEQPKDSGALLGFVQAGECGFPGLLRRGAFFDASREHLAAAREIKRWLLRPAEARGAATTEFETLRRDIADQPGAAAGISGSEALRFAETCAQDFEVTLRLDCRERSRAGVLGDIGGALGLRMAGRLEDNREVLGEWCGRHRALFVLAGTSEADREFLTPGGLASVLFAGISEDFPRSRAAAAVILFQASGDLSQGWTAVRMLKTEERVCEVLELLEEMAARAEGAALERVKREREWIRNDLGYPMGEMPSPVLSPDQQLILPFPR